LRAANQESPPLLVPLSPFAICQTEMLTVLAIATSKTRYFLIPSTVTVSTDVVGPCMLTLRVIGGSALPSRISVAYAWYVKINGQREQECEFGLTPESQHASVQTADDVAQIPSPGVASVHLRHRLPSVWRQNARPSCLGIFATAGLSLLVFSI